MINAAQKLEETKQAIEGLKAMGIAIPPEAYEIKELAEQAVRADKYQKAWDALCWLVLLKAIDREIEAGTASQADKELHVAGEKPAWEAAFRAFADVCDLNTEIARQQIADGLGRTPADILAEMRAKATA